MTIWPDEAEVAMWAARKVKYDCVFDCEADNQPSDLEQGVIKLLNDLLFSAQIASCKKDRYENQMYLFHNYLYDWPVRWLSKNWAWQHNQRVPGVCRGQGKMLHRSNGSNGMITDPNGSSSQSNQCSLQ